MKPNMAGAAASAETKKKERKPLSIIINVILVLAIVLGIFCSFTAYISKKGSGVPSFFGIKPFAIQSDSMAPFFYQGDMILDKSVKNVADLKVGDVITFWTVINGERVLNSHRIIQIDDRSTYLYFTTKGDNNTIEDAIGVHQSEIVGQYMTKVRYMGTVIDFLQTGTGFLLVIVIPVFLFFVYHLVQFFRTLFAYQAEKMRMKIEQEQLAKEQALKSAEPSPGGPTVPAASSENNEQVKTQ